MSSHQQYPYNGERASHLGPGFHFCPTGEELVIHYLTPKVANSDSVFEAIGVVDVNKCEPWELPAMAKVGDQSIIYFFSLKDRKYPTGVRKNRATRAGYWKSTGRDSEVITRTGRVLGMKKTLVFYTGRAPKLRKTNWIMHEYRLQDESSSGGKQWVVCKVFEKKASNKRAAATSNCNGGCNAEWSADQPSSCLPALPSLEFFSEPNSAKPSNLSEPEDYFHGATSLAGPQTILKQSDTTSKVSLDLDLFDFLENLDRWDEDSREPI